MIEKNKKKVDVLINKYKLSESDKKCFLNIINSIFIHYEFQRRMTNEFLHHSNITLGEHILEDDILTYKMCKNRIDIIKISQIKNIFILF